MVHDVSQLISNHSRYRNYGDGEFRLFAALHYFGWGKMGFALATVACAAAPLHLVLFGNQLNGELQQKRDREDSDKFREMCPSATGILRNTASEPLKGLRTGSRTGSTDASDLNIPK